MGQNMGHIQVGSPLMASHTPGPSSSFGIGGGGPNQGSGLGAGENK